MTDLYKFYIHLFIAAVKLFKWKKIDVLIKEFL